MLAASRAIGVTWEIFILVIIIFGKNGNSMGTLMVSLNNAQMKGLEHSHVGEILQ